MAVKGWEVMNHSPYSPVLASSDINLFGPLKLHIVREKFESGNQLQRSVLNCYAVVLKYFTLLASVTFQEGDIVTCRVVRATNMRGSTSVDWIY
jgi:hypothetical protein